MAGYYKKIRGKNYDRALIEKADKSVTGKGDGRISLKDARGILKLVKDSSTYTDIEKRTIRYIRDSYRFTDEADAWFRKEIRKWAATKKSAPKKVKKRKQVIKKTAKKKTPVKKKRTSVKKVAGKVEGKAIVSKTSVESPISAVVSKSRRPVQPAGGILNKILLVIFVILPFVILLLLAIRHKDLIESRKRSPGLPVVITGENEKKPESEKEGDDKKTVQKVEEIHKQKEIQLKEKSAPVNGSLYVVQPGDELNEIGKKFYGNWSGWRKIFNANKDKIKDPDLIHPGLRLKIPDN